MAVIEIIAAVLTISDSAYKKEREDKSGPAVVAELVARGAKVLEQEILSDDPEMITGKLRHYCDRGDINLIFTTGGTGFTPRDNTPEATKAVIEREAPGLAELMRMKSLEKTRLAPLSRGVCGIKGQTLIINLPGSPRGAVENLEAVWVCVPHAVGLLTGQMTRKCAD